MKKQLIGQYTLGYENLLGQMLAMAKDMLDYREVLPFSQHIQAIEEVSSEDILEVCHTLFQPDQLSGAKLSPGGELTGLTGLTGLTQN